MLSKVDFDRLLRPYGIKLKQGIILSLLQNHWSSVVGLENAKKTYPALVISNKIIIITESTTALAFYNSKAADILYDINNYLAGSFVFVDIQFRVGKIPGSSQKWERTSELNRKKEKLYIDDSLEGLERIKVMIEYKKMQKMRRGHSDN